MLLLFLLLLLLFLLLFSCCVLTMDNNLSQFVKFFKFKGNLNILRGSGVIQKCDGGEEGAAIGVA